MATKRVQVVGGYLEIEETDPTTTPDTTVPDPATVPDTATPAPTDPATPPTDPGVDPAGPGTVDPSTDPGRPDPEAPLARPVPAPTGALPLSRNDAQHTPDDDVRAWQQAARDCGIEVGPVDGFFGPRTESGVIAAQNGAGLPATGAIDEATWPVPFQNAA